MTSQAWKTGYQDGYNEQPCKVITGEYRDGYDAGYHARGYDTRAGRVVAPLNA
jgi:hypothetical protein